MYVQKLVAGAVSMAQGALSGCCKGVDMCARHPVLFDLSAEEVKKEHTSIHFDPRKLGDRPPSRELVALFVSPLLLQSLWIRSVGGGAQTSAMVLI